jgi:hypothetical protein
MSVNYPREIHPSDIEILEKLLISDVKNGKTNVYYYAYDTMKTLWIVKYEPYFYSLLNIKRIAFYDIHGWRRMTASASFFDNLHERIYHDWVFFKPCSGLPPGFTSADTETQYLINEIPVLELPPPMPLVTISYVSSGNLYAK